MSRDYKNSNPFFNERYVSKQVGSVKDTIYMSAQATINRIICSFIVMSLGAAMVWVQYYDRVRNLLGTDVKEFITIQGELSMRAMLYSVIGLCIIIPTFFWPKTAAYTTLPYAFCQGASLSSWSLLFELSLPGIALQALSATIIVCFTVLFAHKEKLVTLSDKFRAVLFTVLGAMGILTFLSIVLYHSGMTGLLEILAGPGPIGIAYSIVYIGALSFLLLSDMQCIQEMDGRQLPAYMNWCFCIGVVSTVIRLYLHILMLLSKLRKRRN